MAADPYRYFRLEARDLLDQLTEGVREIRKGGDHAQVVQRLLRQAHTLKGAARIVRQNEIADRAHAIEDVLEPSRQPGASVSSSQLELISGLLGEIRIPIQALESPGIANAPTQPGEVSEDVLRIVRADVLEIDTVVDGAAEARAQLNELRTTTRTLGQARQTVNLLEAQVALRTDAGPNRLSSIVVELKRQLTLLDRRLGSTTERLDRELGQLRESAEQLRLVSVATLFKALERTAADTASLLSKSVVFESSGGEIRLDAHILSVVQSALVQIVRNAVAHGVEPEPERRHAGKPATGRVTVAATRRGRRIVITCRDDGRGIDHEAVRRLALQRGMIAVDARPLGPADLIDLLLRGGISTSSSVTEAAGRGIGLEIVREALRQLNGEVKVRTEVGEGTTFEVVIPPSLAAMDALIVAAADMVAAIPLDTVQTTLRLAAGAVASGPSGLSIMHERQTIPFLLLSNALGRPQPPVQGNQAVIVLRSTAGFVAVGVDRLTGTARIIVRPLPDAVQAHPVVSGAWFNAEGNPQLVLDPDALLSEAQRQRPAENAAPPARLPILVVDDSLTTRMLEENILQSAGYDVATATSAEEALECARTNRYGLFLVDVEMPGMDGFTFVERIRKDPALHAIPAIMVTSRAAPEDRQRGREVGAQGYVVKSEFDQAGFLAMVAQAQG